MSAEVVETEAKPAVKPVAPGRVETGGRYARYALLVLVLVYVFNFIDRQILSILAEEIKADLGLTDASIGFLYGTAFAVFYAVFGIPLARFADLWARKSLIALGLCFWSLMTALSGTARSFFSLGVYRIGVGIGESSASPAAFSMLGDYFPPRLRATAVAIYSSGVYIGAGLGIFLGGWIVEGWNTLFPEGNAPFGLVGWQAAFLAVGVPGLLMAIWVGTLREPVRGQSEGIPSASTHPHPFRELGQELFAVLPPCTLISLARAGAGPRGLALNVAVGVVCAGAAGTLIQVLGSPAQWIALGVGFYSFSSWIHGLALRDRATFAMIFRSRAIVFGVVGFGWCAFVGYSLIFWAPPFFLRVHGVSAGEAGTFLGLAAALGGWIGVTGGGLLSDYAKPRLPRARLYVGMSSAIFAGPFGVLFLWSPDLYAAYAFNFLYQIFSSMWIGSAIALVNELVLPRMRATSSAFYILTVTFIGLALGPYSMGKISDALVQAGSASGDALRTALLMGLLAYGLTIVFLFVASRFVESEETQRIARARAAGENV